MTKIDRIAKGLYWDRAWSLFEGCTQVDECCTNCWAQAQTHMRAGQSNPKILARYGGLTSPTGKFNGKVRFMEQDLDRPLKAKQPLTWAIWNDMFHKGFLPSDIVRTLNIIGQADWHTFLALTKRPDRARYILSDYYEALGIEPYPNLWA